jgi:hypothetical protein
MRAVRASTSKVVEAVREKAAPEEDVPVAVKRTLYVPIRPGVKVPV